jgi:hypothetical protein
LYGIPLHSSVVVAYDATGRNEGGRGGTGYIFAIGVLPVNGQEPCWASVMPTDQGDGSEAAEDVAAVIEAADELGMKVGFVATDGDHDTNEAHRVAHSKYARVYLSLVKQRHAEPRGVKGVKGRKWMKDHRAPRRSRSIRLCAS